MCGVSDIRKRLGLDMRFPSKKNKGGELRLHASYKPRQMGTYDTSNSITDNETIIRGQNIVL